MKKRRIFPLSPEMYIVWKQSCVDYLKRLYGKPMPELAAALMALGVLIPRERLKGYLLLEPGMMVSEAYYLRIGLVKLYSIDAQAEKRRFSTSGRQVASSYCTRLLQRSYPMRSFILK